jgi:hypothetical protein
LQSHGLGIHPVQNSKYALAIVLIAVVARANTRKAAKFIAMHVFPSVATPNPIWKKSLAVARPTPA